LVDANIIGIVFWNVEGQIVEANEAFLHMVGYGREDLVSGRLSWSEVTPAKWRGADEQALAELAATGVCEPFEKEYFRKDGSRVPVLIGAALLEGRRDEGVAFVLDLTERNLAEEALHKTQAELAHVTRVTTMGELVASIAHEVNQPLGAIVTNGSALLRLLSRETPDLDKSREVISRMINEGLRASEVIKRIRGLLQKAPPEKVLLNINETVQEVIALVGSDVLKSKVELRSELAANLPPVIGDRIQLQQVILNLILNAKDAMSEVRTPPRELLITTLKKKAGDVVVAVRDCGKGLDPNDAERIFDPFFTTKAEGMGLGLSISRTIIEAHGGTLWATANEDCGATIQFTLPPSSASESSSLSLPAAGG
jgi:PAS domain S-box-containing protein